jgi:quercetin dioxygenase-like cupin family protein
MTDEPASVLWSMPFCVLVDAADSGGAVSVCAIDVPPGAATPSHRHSREDELLHVLEGAVAVWVGPERRTLRPGDSVRLPCDVPHGFEHVAPTGGCARVLLLALPAGLEATLQVAAAGLGEEPDPDDLAALLAGAGVSILPWRPAPTIV